MADAPNNKLPDEAKTEFQFPDEKEETKDAAPQQNEADEETDIEIVDDTPLEDRGHKPGVSRDITEVSDEELAAYSGNVQKRIKELSFARHDERRAKEAALREREELERVAQTILKENEKLKAYVKTGEQAYISTSKAAAQAKLEMAKSKYRAAHEAFDADAELTALEELTAAKLELQAADNFKPTALQSESNENNLGSTQQVRLDPRTEKWQSENRWFGSNKRMTAYAIAVHQELVDSGIDPRTDEYFKRIDAEVRQTFPKEFGNASSSADNQPHRKPATVVAPTARSGGAKKITLTQTQVTLAKRLGITPAEYAKQVAILERQNG